MRLYSLVMLEPNEYRIEIECEPEVTENFVITVSETFIDGKKFDTVVGCSRFIARVPDAMTRRDIYKLVGQFRQIRVEAP